MRYRLASITLVIPALLGLMSTTSGAASAPSPYAQMKAVVADADAQLSVRVTTSAKMSGNRVVQITDAGRHMGRQTITLTSAGKSNTVTIDYLSGALYAKGDETILYAYLGLTQATANELAGQWFGISKSSVYYQEIAQGLTISTGMAEVAMTSTVTRSASVTLDGAKVNVLKGMSVKSAIDPSLKESLYFSTSAKPLPVEVVQSVPGSSGTIKFSHWGEKFSVVAPKVTQHLN